MRELQGLINELLLRQETTTRETITRRYIELKRRLRHYWLSLHSQLTQYSAYHSDIYSMDIQIRLIPEWEAQDAVIISWPHAETDWAHILDEADACYRELARAILRFEDLIILTPEVERIQQFFGEEAFAHQLRFIELPTNDTWVRDYGPLSFRLKTEEEELKAIADFTFNGWGMKFAADADNLVNRALYVGRYFASDIQRLNNLLLVLEGGGVESDGEGTILTTESCIFEPNRNPGFDEEELKAMLRETLGADRLLMLRHGDLEGDDTDGHIDTLARFVDTETIAYVCCDDTEDEHYHRLKRMEQELEQLTTPEGKPYRLIPLPLPSAIHEEDGHRLPATYANFLFVNGGLLVPTYAQSSDEVALSRLREALPGLEVVGVDCRTLIRQHGSLHCATMQLPQGFINPNK